VRGSVIARCVSLRTVSVCDRRSSRKAKPPAVITIRPASATASAIACWASTAASVPAVPSGVMVTAAIPVKWSDRTARANTPPAARGTLCPA
jgi:hypothetical protein